MTLQRTLKNSLNPRRRGSVSIGDHSLPAYLAGTPEGFSYDLDGNLTGDGHWNYSYDGENRVNWVQTSSAAVAAGATQQGFNYYYDYLGRRVLKILSKCLQDKTLG